MRAGKLDRQITIQRSTYTVDDYGSPVYSWVDVANLRAEVVQASTEEFIRAYGASDETVIIFRTRYVEGVGNADRVQYQGEDHNIKEVKEIGRRNGLELRCLRIGS